jgi:phosphotransferase system HPr (HPr) family protein
MEITEKARVVNKLGLHLRAAAELVKTAHKFKSKITVRHQERSADAKSLINLIALGIPYGAEITMTFEGEDAWLASREILGLFKLGFRELELAVS